MGFFSSLGTLIGKNSKVNAPATPDYYEDPNFTGTQTFLKDYAEKMLQGNMPDYYKAIGEPAGTGMMSDYITEMTKQGLNQDLEAGAITGRGRTGLSSNAINSANQTNAALRYADYARAMQGRQGLLQTGLDTESGVRSAAFSNMGEKNPFNQWKYSADLSQEMRRAAASNARTKAQWGAADDMANDVAAAVAAPYTGGMSLGLSSMMDQYGGGKSSALNPNTSSISSPDYGAMSFKSGGGSGNNAQLMALVAKMFGGM